MDGRIPQAIRQLLTDYLSVLQDQIPALVGGLYLHGSVALDAFNERMSDVDFIAFLNRQPGVDDLERLATIHRILAQRYPRWALEGSYLQWQDLGALEEDASPSPCHHDGKFTLNQKFEINLVTWWILKNRGITLIGPPPQDLPLEVDRDLLEEKMKENLNSYWLRFVTRPRAIAWLLNDYGIQWAVLGVLRQYYSFVTHEITSKSGAGEYALLYLPSKWHKIIREALRLRSGEPPSLYRVPLGRAADAYNFLKYIIRYCNSLNT